MEPAGISTIAQYGTAGISVLQVFVIVWMIDKDSRSREKTAEKHAEAVANLFEKVEGISKSTLSVIQANNGMLEKYAKIIGNHIDHNTDQMKLVIEQMRENNLQKKDDNIMAGQLRDAINQLVGMNKK
jgi:hypothetical protein